MDHVVDVMPTLVKLNTCGTNLDLVNIHGVPADVLRSFRPFTMIEGDYESFAREQAAAIVGRELAQRRGWAVGEAADINGINFNIRGIYETGGSTYESMVMVHLNFLQQTLGIGAGGYSTQLYVKIDDASQAEAVANAIDDYFATDAILTDTKPERAFLAKAIKEFGAIIQFSRILGFVAIGILLLLVANTITMSVQDRRTETAVLRTLGFTPARVFSLILAESLLLSLIGGGIGAAAAWATLNWGHFGLGIEGYQIAFHADPVVLAAAVAAAAGLGLVGGLLPGLGAARMNIVNGLRAT